MQELVGLSFFGVIACAIFLYAKRRGLFAYTPRVGSTVTLLMLLIGWGIALLFECLAIMILRKFFIYPGMDNFAGTLSVFTALEKTLLALLLWFYVTQLPSSTRTEIWK